MIKLIRSTSLRYLTRLRQVLCQTSITFVLVALLCLSLGIGLAGTYKLSINLIDKQAESYAQTVIQNLEETQTMYSQRIVQSLSSVEGVTVSANYHQIAGGIPIPTTYMIELSQQLSQQPNSPRFSIYSDYPFSDRKGEARDNFQTEALKYLNQHPTETFNRKEHINHRTVFRYAKAIRMQASCVECHNNLSNSPKKDWKVGDVRGAIEITQPLDSILSILKENIRQLYLLLFAITGLSAAGLILTIQRFHNIKDDLEKQVAERTIELRRLANLDGLTQLANRRQFDQVIKTEWKRLSRPQQPLSLLLCDVDDFKKYNDTYGHQQGDDCLITVSQLLRETVQRAGDLVARYGGEEFVVVLPHSDSRQAIAIATRIQQALKDWHIPHDTSRVAPYITLSIGISTLFPQRGKSHTQLIELADKALYQAKDNGRNQFVVWTNS